MRTASVLVLLAALVFVLGVALVLVGALAGAALADGEPLFNAGVAAIAVAALLAVAGRLLVRRG